MSKHGKEEATDTAESPILQTNKALSLRKRLPASERYLMSMMRALLPTMLPANDERYKFTGLQVLSKKRLPTSLQVVP